MSWRALTAFLVMGSNIFLAGCQGWMHSNQYGRFERVGDMHFPRSEHTATLLQDGRVLIAGGGTGKFYNRQLEIYDPKTKTFTLAGKLQELHGGARTAPLLKDGRVIFAGGPGEHIEIYDPKTQKTVILEKTLENRGRHTITVLKDGRVLLAGGMPKTPNKLDFYGEILDSAEIFDPTTSKVTWAGKMTTPRSSHQAFLLKDGRVFITGGDLASSPQGEFYVPSSGKFLVSNIHLFQRLGRGTQNTDNRVVILEGVSAMSKPAYPAEIIDPYKESLQTSRVFFEKKHAPVIASLDNGKVFVAGGAVSGFGPSAFLSQAEIFDVRRDTILQLPEMHEKRIFATATRLLDGSILVTGGYYPDHFNKSCELFIEK
jgi:hypothetical protein